jgi:BCD family chlorophyll transporter-like MFS transporter
VLAGGLVRDLVAALAPPNLLGLPMADAALPYSSVYHLEIGLLFAALIALGPLARRRVSLPPNAGRFGLAELPS